jgi:hypothetical protein
MIKQVEVAFTNKQVAEKSVIDFFTRFDFKLIGDNEKVLQFKRSGTILNAWKVNPLLWGARITVQFFEASLKAEFEVDTNGQMNTKEESEVWSIFIDVFEVFIKTGKLNTSQINFTLAKNKKSRIAYFYWTFLGALVGVVLIVIFKKFTNNTSVLTYFLIPLLMAYFLRRPIKNLFKKNGD